MFLLLMQLIHEVLQLLTKECIPVTDLKCAGKISTRRGTGERKKNTITSPDMFWDCQSNSNKFS